MLSVTQELSLPTIKTVLLTTVLLSSAPLMTGCDSQPSNSNDDVTAQTDNIDKNTAKSDETSTHSTSINSPPINATTDKAKAIETKNISNHKVVNPSGYQQLSFGQVITPELLNELGLTKEKTDNEQCYYVSNPTLNYMDKEYGKRASVLYQIIDDKVALITIQDPNIAFYTDIHVGDAVAEVMQAHDNKLTYEVDKYAVDGDYYNLIANVNFKVIKEPELGESLKAENMKLDRKEDKLPLQIEYHIKGGQTLNEHKVKATEWTADKQSLLKGEVESIDIGTPEAIYLVEGCS
ncbi:hypothetical protein [Psychrobacter sp. M9-54-1]|uniref:hypothetical protein n=1 Tax=Psychrobacter sp. M9-54-1 TaxID=2782386 RepID=UPI00190AED27|nr:hypothetical protein [Psychrobacter sp. M9-54-1]MBK3392981.1 hypothetical protein [Psychrobacter sp. M9-54-1]